MAAKSPSRGYLVEFVEKPPEEAETDCPICFHVIFKPKLALCCHHSFCSDCISNTEHEGKPCPLCGEEIQLIDDKRLERTLNGYTVYCPHKEKGCEWTGELGQLEKHLNRQEATTATAAGGGGGGEDLMKGCQYQVIQCGLCQSHQCERRLMPDHVSSGCPDVLVECEYHYAGCEFKSTQREMDVHIRNSVGVHFSLVSKSTQSRLAQKDREIVELRAELRQLKVDLQQQKDATNTQIQEVRQQCTEQSQQVQLQNAQQLRKSTKWQKKFRDHRMWIMFLIAVVGVVHGCVHQSLNENHDIRENVDEINGTLNNRTTFLEHNESDIVIGMFKEKFDDLQNHVENLTTTLEENYNDIQEVFSTYINESYAYVQNHVENLTATSEENYKDIQEVLSKYIDQTYTDIQNHVENLTATSEENIQQVLTEYIDQRYTDIQQRLIEYIDQRYKEKNGQLQLQDIFPLLITSKDFEHMKTEFQYLGQRVDFPILPVHINLTQVQEKKMNKTRWLSMPFYTHERGYKMRLIVYPDGTKSGSGKYVSVAVWLMSGKYDDQLDWPLNITINITLLNQQNGHINWRNCKLNILSYSGSVVQRVQNDVMAKEGALFSMFAAHERVFTDALKDDQLHFVIEKSITTTSKSSWFKFW